jgi:hypothetical protein
VGVPGKKKEGRPINICWHTDAPAIQRLLEPDKVHDGLVASRPL